MIIMAILRIVTVNRVTIMITAMYIPVVKVILTATVTGDKTAGMKLLQILSKTATT